MPYPSDAHIFRESDLFNSLKVKASGLPTMHPLGTDNSTLRNYPRTYTLEDGAAEKRYFKSQDENSKVSGNALRFIANRFKCLRAQHQKTNTVNDIVEATVVLRLWHTVESLDVDRLIKLTKYEADTKAHVRLRNLRDREHISVKVLSLVSDGSHSLLAICIFKIVSGRMNCVSYHVQLDTTSLTRRDQ